MAFVPISIALAWMTIQAPSAPAGGARVIPEELPVYEAASPASKVIRILKRDQTVMVDLRIAGTGGPWCGIRSEIKGHPGGYVVCSHLAQSGTGTKAPQYTAVTEAPEAQQAPKAAAGGESRARPAAASPAPEAWMDAFGFDGAQREQAMALLEASGVSGCRASLATLFLNLGITDSSSFVDWMSRTKEPVRTQQAGRVDATLEPCMRKYRAFWKEFGSLMSPEQKQKAQSDSMFAFLQSSLRSAPEMVVFGDVMHYVRRTGMAPPSHR